MADHVSVRMYRVGFGDCFLLSFYTPGRVTRVLIDCGSITEGAAQVDKVAKSVVDSCKDADGVPRIALVVATHRHKDHVGGFSSTIWNDVEVGAVWMPWTEDPADPQATRIRNRQSALASALCAATGPERLAGAAETADASDVLAAMAFNALTNEKSMKTLHGGFKTCVAPEFLPRADAPWEVRRIAGLEAVRVHVLGPPRDEKAIANMDPPTGKGYLTQPGEPSTAAAFGPHWRVAPEARDGVFASFTFSREDEKAVAKAAEQPLSQLAAALDKAVNNTSLILMFEFGDQFLLFPGDAQWGAWKAALDSDVARALLAKTTFYKVGHHGSHNATPTDLIEAVINTPFSAMFSTCQVKQWPNIPRAPLLAAIAGKAKRYARSDDEKAAGEAGFRVEPDLFIEFDLPADIMEATPPTPPSGVAASKTASKPAPATAKAAKRKKA